MAHTVTSPVLLGTWISSNIYRPIYPPKMQGKLVRPLLGELSAAGFFLVDKKDLRILSCVNYLSTVELVRKAGMSH